MSVRQLVASTSSLHISIATARDRRVYLRSVDGLRTAAASPKQPPANLEPFLSDEDLEGRRLERVLGWALLFVTMFAVAMPLYWCASRPVRTTPRAYFDEGAVERGRSAVRELGERGLQLGALAPVRELPRHRRRRRLDDHR